MTVGRVRGYTPAAALLAVVTMLPVPAFAGDGIATTGKRLVADAVRQTAPATPGVVPSSVRLDATAFVERLEAQPTGLTRSGLSRGKKLAIGVGLAVAFAAVVVAIDRGVEDNTPSSRGLR